MDCLLSATFVLLLFLCSTPLHAHRAVQCTKNCPEYQKCEIQERCYRDFCYPVPTCVPNPLAPRLSDEPERPPSCQDFECDGAADGSEVCVLVEVFCFRPPCFPVPACIPNKCIFQGVCFEPGSVCVTVRRPEVEPDCSGLGCLFTTACVPRAKPKPGFCPAPEQVPNTDVDLCEFDNDCPSNLLCCQGTGEGRSCTAPAFPDPCKNHMCPPSPDIIAGTCIASSGEPSCSDLVCQPGSFFCINGKQCYCSDGGQEVCTQLPAPEDCVG